MVLCSVSHSLGPSCSRYHVAAPKAGVYAAGDDFAGFRKLLRWLTVYDIVLCCLSRAHQAKSGSSSSTLRALHKGNASSYQPSHGSLVHRIKNIHVQKSLQFRTPNKNIQDTTAALDAI
mmetsp:Transcript_16182/g.28345  ORF Transcript_16182/g.28345 Transcript_16182/m.28345 type:complete len:119 (+) Transcript_16182:29-385(+)